MSKRLETDDDYTYRYGHILPYSVRPGVRILKNYGSRAFADRFAHESATGDKK